MTIPHFFRDFDLQGNGTEVKAGQGSPEGQLVADSVTLTLTVIHIHIRVHIH